jgi:lipopolysaccharide biosynthesis glycosyltransferase
MARHAALVIADQKQFPPAVFLASRLAALKGERDIDVILATNAPAAFAEARGFSEAFDLLDLSNLHAGLDLPAAAHFTRATFFSVFAPRLLQERYERLLYIDVDAYPESEHIFDVFDLDLAGNMLAAVRDLNIPFIPNEGNVAELTSTLGVDRRGWLGARYLNSGVLLIDLDAYRRDRFEKKALRLIRDNTVALRYADQTIFNALLGGKWLELSPAFNMVSTVWQTFVRDFTPPVVVHFAGSVKPWHRAFAYDHSMPGELAAFLQNTPWARFLADINPPPTLAHLAEAAKASMRPIRSEPWPKDEREAVVRYLATTPFADVEQKLTLANRAALPLPG